jgi:hypothetical protein
MNIQPIFYGFKIDIDPLFWAEMYILQKNFSQSFETHYFLIFLGRFGINLR